MQKERLVALDLIRGLCALAVLVYHYTAHFTGEILFGIGHYAVYMFFILSGFALHYVYGQRAIDETMLRRFFLARFMRIGPLWIAITGLAIATYAWDSGAISRFALNASFFFGITNPGLHSPVPGGWSIGIEFAFYALFPIVLLFRGISAQLGLFVFAIVMRELYMVDTLLSSAYPDETRWFHSHQIISFLVFFIAGTLGATIFEKFGARLVRPKWGFALTFVSVALLALVLAWTQIFNVSELYILIGWSSFALIGLGGLCIFIGAVARPTGALAMVSGWLGDISYAVYLFHVFILLGLEIVFETSFLTISPVETAGLAALLTVVAATLSFHFFEMPLRRLGYRLTTRGAPSPTPTPRPSGTL